MRDRRRLAVLIPSMDGGGAERVVVNLLKGLVSEAPAGALEIDLVLVRKQGPLLDEVPPGVNVVELRGGRIIASLPSLVRYLRRRRPDALLSHLDTMNVVAVLARKLAGVSTRVVVTTHVLLSSHARGVSWRQRLTAGMVPWVYARADAVVGVSAGVVADLETRLPAGRVPLRVIHNPIVSDDLRERSEVILRAGVDPADLEVSAGVTPIPPGVRLVLAVGRLAPQKNHALLLEAFARLARDVPDLHLAILGEGRERPALERRVAELDLGDRVTLAGFVTDPAPWYAAASVFALTSDWEGFGNVLIEAMLYGCPVVSTRCPSGPEEILEDGRYGRLVPMGDAPALAAAITRTLADQVDRDARLRERALEFSVDRAAGEYLSLLFPQAAR